MPKAIRSLKSKFFISITSILQENVGNTTLQHGCQCLALL